MSSFTTTVTRMGETWDMISKRVYGDEHYMSMLIDANVAHRDIVRFPRGVVLNVPGLDADAAAYGDNLPPWKR